MLLIGILKAERDSLKSAGTIPRVCSALGSTKHSPHVSCKATEYHSPFVNTRRHISTSVSYHVIKIRNQKAQFVTKKKRAREMNTGNNTDSLDSYRRVQELLLLKSSWK